MTHDIPLPFDLPAVCRKKLTVDFGLMHYCSGLPMEIYSGVDSDEVVVMELHAPALMRGILGEHDLTDGFAHCDLLASVGAQLAAENADRIGAFAERPVIPALDGGEAEADRLGRGGMLPGALGQRLDCGLQLAFGRRRGQQLADDGEAQMRPPLVNSWTLWLLGHAGAPLDQEHRL